MCGIAGYFAAGGIDPDLGKEMLERMIKALDHRGPDDRGTFVSPHCGLASTRLAIVDVQGGHMPITADEGRVVAVVNGEIYDHKETRQRLEKAGRRFATYSDSEVVPQLYAESGPDIAPHLSGMFAFAVWDRREERLVLGRDRFGMKPLYLAQKDGLWMFASEVKALLATGKIERKIDQRALLDVLTAGYPMPPRSIVEGVRALPPAMQMTLTKSQTSTTQYWHMPYGRRGETALAKRTRYDDAVEEVRQTFDDVVKAHLMADVEVGSYLSGGLDSVSVAARAKALGSGQLRTYSLVFPGPEKGFDESEHSRIAAAAIGSRHQEVPLEGITEADYVGTIRAMESPQVHTVAFCLYRLARAVKEDGLKVVLSGEGADETFAGYGVFRLSKLRRTPIGQWMGLRRLATRYALKNRQPELSRSLDRWWGHEKALEKRYGVVPPWVEQWWLLGDAATPLLGRSLEMPESVPGLDLATITDPLQRELAFEQRTRLDGWVLPLGDRLSMAHGIEVRPPFLDHRLAEKTAAVPASYLLRGMKEKRLLRGAMVGQIPEAIRARKKRAFIAPVASWLFGPSRPAFVDARLDEPRLLDRARLAELRAVVARGERNFAHLQAAWALNVGLGLEVLVRELDLTL